jgi:hypothetical protein
MSEYANFELGPFGLSLQKQSIEEDITELFLVQASAYQLGNEIALCGKAMAEKLKSLAPLLARVNDLLGQRGLAHKLYKGQELPSWEQWALEFMETTKLHVSFSTIKRAIRKYRFEHQEPATIHSQKLISSKNIETQQMCFAALAALEIADARSAGRNFEGALVRLRETGVTRNSILRLLKKLGVNEVPEDFVLYQDLGNVLDSDLATETPAQSIDLDSLKPGSWTQGADIADRTLGPALKMILAIENPELRIQCLEKIVVHIIQKWVSIDANLGHLEIKFNYLAKPRPALRIA